MLRFYTILSFRRKNVNGLTVTLKEFHEKITARKMRTKCTDQPLKSRFNVSMTLLSMREICTCETPIALATSLCVMSRK